MCLSPCFPFGVHVCWTSCRVMSERCMVKIIWAASSLSGSRLFGREGNRLQWCPLLLWIQVCERMAFQTPARAANLTAGHEQPASSSLTLAETFRDRRASSPGILLRPIPLQDVPKTSASQKGSGPRCASRPAAQHESTKKKKKKKQKQQRRPPCVKVMSKAMLAAVAMRRSRSFRSTAHTAFADPRCDIDPDPKWAKSVFSECELVMEGRVGCPVPPRRCMDVPLACFHGRDQCQA